MCLEEELLKMMDDVVDNIIEQGIREMNEVYETLIRTYYTKQEDDRKVYKY